MTGLPESAPALHGREAEAVLFGLLLGALRPGGVSAMESRLRTLAQREWLELLNISKRHGVAPLLFKRLKDGGACSLVPPAVLLKLEKGYLETAGRSIIRSQALRSIAAILDAAGVPIIVLKGAFLAEVVYGNAAVRPMLDLDLLVRGPDLADAVKALEASGYRRTAPFNLELGRDFAKHLPTFLAPGGGVRIEIHWALCRPGYAKPIDPLELWERRVPATLAGSELWALSIEDLLIHLAAHVSYEHEFDFGLRPYCDIEATIRHFGTCLDWNVVVSRCRQWGWERGVGLALRLARNWLDAAVPDEVLAALLPELPEDAIFQAIEDGMLGDGGDAVTRQLVGKVAIVLGAPGFAGKLRAGLDRLFLKREEVAWETGSSPSSIWLTFHYVRRQLRVTVQYAPVFFRLMKAPGRYLTIARSRRAVSQWLMR